RLRPAGIGRAMMPGIPPNGIDGFACRSSLDKAGGSNEKSAAETRRRKIDEVIEPGSSPAEGFVAGGAMADHAVGRIDRLVRRASGQSADPKPEGRRDDAVGKV